MINDKKLLLVDINYFKLIGEKFLESAELLSKQSNFQDHIYSFNILISQAVEILGKSLIAIKILAGSDASKEEILKNEINKKLKLLKHRLDKILKELPEIKKQLNIVKVEFFINQFLKEYYFEIINIKNRKSLVIIKDLESARYSSLAFHKNVSVINNSNDVLQFVNKYKEEVNRLYEKIKQKI